MFIGLQHGLKLIMEAVYLTCCLSGSLTFIPSNFPLSFAMFCHEFSVLWEVLEFFYTPLCLV